jgi:hypothetical protein
MSENLDAKKYWKSFEILAVKIVKIQIEGILEYGNLEFHEDSVPLTRDHGIDGQLHITLRGNDISITVEAKLRSKGPLGLKEFASSIVNYFINLSDIHFVVTNVEFSDDAQNILKSIQKKREKNCLNYIDGFLIKQSIKKIKYNDCNQEQKEQLEDLISYFSKQNYSHTIPIQYQISEANLKKKFAENTYILPQHISAENEIYNLLKRNNCFLIVEGDKGIGKSYVIKRALASYSENASVISIDLSSDWSCQTLLLEITKELLQLDFSKLLALLSENDKKDLNQQILENANKEDDYLIALKQLLFFDVDEKAHYNYLVRTFFTNILEKTKISIILYLYNCIEISMQVSNFFLNFLPAITDKIKTIVEVDNVPLVQSTEESMSFVRSLRQYSQGEISATIYSMFECKKDEVLEYIKRNLHISSSQDIANYICYRYGCNLMVLTDVLDFINQNGIKTQTEIAKMPLVQYGTFSNHLLEQYCHKLSEKEKKAFNWSSAIIELLDGHLNYELLKELEDKLNIDNISNLLLDTPFFEETDAAIVVKNSTYKKILTDPIPHFEKLKVIQFLLKHKKIWDLSEVQTQYKECCFKLISKKEVDILEIKSLITMLSVQNLTNLKSNFLFLCYQYYDSTDAESKNTLFFLVEYLESITEKLLYCSKENNALLEKANNLCQSQIATMKKTNIDTGDIYELQVKIYFLYYNQQKTLFRFDLAEEFVDKGLLLEQYCHDNELIGKMYWCKGLCLKERGIKPGFLDFMLKGIKKYPDAMYLKICYLSNYASSNFKTDLNKSYKALAVGIQLAQKAQFIDLEVWLSNNQIICNLTKKDFSEACLKQIINIREKADRYELLSDISRAYNNEGVWHFENGNTSEALDCLQHALNIFDESVTDQQKFLFRTNKIVLLWKEKKDIRNDLNILYDWLKDNYRIMESKLNRTSNLRKENNYAAVLSLYKVSCITGQNWFAQKLTEWFKYPAFDSIKNNPINAFEPGKDIIDKGFLVKNEIFILF